MGVLVSLKQPVFKCGSRISRNPPYPLELRKLEVIDSIGMEVIT